MMQCLLKVMPYATEANTASVFSTGWREEFPFNFVEKLTEDKQI